MTRRISLITAVAGLAFVLAVPVASGNGQPVQDSSNRDQRRDVQRPIVSPDAVDRAVAVREAQQSGGRSLVFDNHRVGNQPQSAGRTLVFDNHRVGNQPQSAGRTLVFDNHRLDGARSEQISATSSGREIEWPQLGIGFGIGIALMLGFWLVLRMTHTRPLAH